MHWLAVVAALSSVDAEDPSLPPALPPLDVSLLDDVSDDVAFFGQGRVRSVFEDGFDHRFVAAGLTGRVGASGSVSDVRAAVVVGEGDWWAAVDGASVDEFDATTALRLVRRPLAPFIERLSLEIPLSPLGAPGQLVVGRQPLQVADGRFVGAESYDAHGRSVDGAVIDASFGAVLVRAGAAALDLGAEGSTDDAGIAGVAALAFVDVTVGPAADDDGDDVARDPDVDLYVVAHHDASVLRPTLGARAALELFGVRLKIGADAQAALDETSGLAPTSSGLHGELTTRTVLPWHLDAPRPFVEAGVEGTGDVVTAAGNQHGLRGDLDLVAARNTAQVFARFGVESVDGFVARATWRHVEPLGDMVDPRGVAVAGVAFSEIDVDAALPVADHVVLDVGWAVAVREAAPSQRLLLSLRFDFGDDGGLLPPF